MSRGDHIYYFRAAGTYSHHGIDCGDGTVIHFETTPWQKLVASTLKTDVQSPRITRTSLAEFVDGHDVNEILVHQYVGQNDTEADVQRTMERAESRLGEEGYSLFHNNCEHFAVWCKTGVAASAQVNAHRRAAENVAVGTPILAVYWRWSRRLPRPYRVLATLGAVGAAGVVYATSYVKHRMHNPDHGMA